MKSLASYLIIIFVIVFWIFRVIVALSTTMSFDIGIEPINKNIEIILLFVTIPAIVLIVKRNLIGAFLYFATYLIYFGQDAFNQVMEIINITAVNSTYISLFFSSIAVFLAIAVLIDVLFNKNRTSSIGKNKKTDWYYKEGNYEREYDERADKNNYRTM